MQVFKPWQWAEIWGLILAIAVQLWLHTVSLAASLLWGLVVFAVIVHCYTWMVPLLREQRRRRGRGDP